MVNNKESLDKREVKRRLALLALASEQQEEALGDCPEPEVFAAFLEGNPAAPEYQAVLGHVSRCESCYQRWLELSRELGRAGQGASKAGSLVNRKRWLSGAGSIGAIALGIMLFLSLDYQAPEQQSAFQDAPETAPQAVPPSVRMQADEDHGATEEQEAVIRTSPAKTVYSARQPAQRAGATEPAAEAERLEKQKGEGGGYESVQEVRLPEPLDAQRVQPAEKRAGSILVTSDQLSGTMADSGHFMDLVFELCESAGDAEVPTDKRWEQKRQMLQDQGHGLLESGKVQGQERSQVERVLELIAGETGAASVDREQLCRRLVLYLQSLQPEQ
ncbi:MAG: hypothetical protein WBW79_18440 [Desulfocapsaceae bacterium]